LNVPFGAGRACLFACALGVSFGLTLFVCATIGSAALL
jgi:hypothetical protein